MLTTCTLDATKELLFQLPTAKQEAVLAVRENGLSLESRANSVVTNRKSGKFLESLSFQNMHKLHDHFQLLVLENMTKLYVSSSEIQYDIEFYYKFTVRFFFCPKIFSFLRKRPFKRMLLYSRNLHRSFCQAFIKSLGNAMNIHGRMSLVLAKFSKYILRHFTTPMSFHHIFRYLHFPCLNSNALWNKCQ